VVIGVVDNGMAISVEPSSGRAICDMAAYAKAFGADFYVTDGNDFLDVYQNYRVAMGKAKARQRPAIIWVQNLPRLNNHSSAAQFQFDLGQHDPLVDFGQEMVREGLLDADQVMQRNPEALTGNFFNNYQLGAIAQREQREIEETWEAVAQEPDPTLEQTKEDVRLEFPPTSEPDYTGRPTHIMINGAIRAALRDTIEENPLTWVNGQDTGMKGGVMQATAGLWELFPKHVTDAPINEPAIMWIALGYALNEKAIAFPEIQFGDYSTSGLHAMVHAGGLLWTSGGTRKVNWNLRLPVEPGIYGAVYHSTPLEGLYAAIPGMTIVAPSTSRDAYGLIRSAAEYAGPVIIFEPKKLYRLPIGDAFPNEPRDPEEAKEKYKDISLRRGIPDIDRDFRVPLGKAAIRRQGKDLTLVTWGLSHYLSLNALKPLREAGISVELIDLRTIVPPDMETVLKSVGKTGRLLVVHQDRVFSSLGREIQGQVHEAFPGTQIHTKVLGMEPVPGIPQARPMEDAVRVSEEDIVRAATEIMKR
jgi:2-oxoisovalerate dehydrogenase E1 component